MDELESQVASMVVNTPPRRSTRKRLCVEAPPTPPAKYNRKSSNPTPLTMDKLRKFYMNKTSAKFARQALETIYEEPMRGRSDDVTLFQGVPKIKRTINMDRDLGSVTKHKKLCRKKKIKRLGIGTKFKKLSDEDFKKRLMLLDAEFYGQEAPTKPCDDIIDEQQVKCDDAIDLPHVKDELTDLMTSSSPMDLHSP